MNKVKSSVEQAIVSSSVHIATAHFVVQCSVPFTPVALIGSRMSLSRNPDAGQRGQQASESDSEMERKHKCRFCGLFLSNRKRHRQQENWTSTPPVPTTPPAEAQQQMQSPPSVRQLSLNNASDEDNVISEMGSPASSLSWPDILPVTLDVKKFSGATTTFLLLYHCEKYY